TRSPAHRAAEPATAPGDRASARTADATPRTPTPSPPAHPTPAPPDTPPPARRRTPAAPSCPPPEPRGSPTHGSPPPEPPRAADRASPTHYAGRATLAAGHRWASAQTEPTPRLPPCQPARPGPPAPQPCEEPPRLPTPHVVGPRVT